MRPKRTRPSAGSGRRKWCGRLWTIWSTRTSRDEHRVDICRYWLGTDSVQILIEERLNTYIDVCDFELLKNGQIVMRSERNGWAQLYLHGADGKLIRPLTNGAYHVSAIMGVDESTSTVFFTANGFDKNEHPYYNHLFRVGLNGSGLKMLNPGNYYNDSWMPEDLKYFVNNASRVDAAPVNALYNASGAKIMDLEACDISRLVAYGYKYPEIFTAKAADGVTDLWGVIYNPFSARSFLSITRLSPSWRNTISPFESINAAASGSSCSENGYIFASTFNRFSCAAMMGSFSQKMNESSPVWFCKIRNLAAT